MDLRTNNQGRNVNFGYKIAVDIGASVAGGSFKLKLYDKGIIIDEFSKHLSPGGVKSSDEFIKRISDSIKFAQNMAKNATDRLPDPAARQLEAIDIFTTGRPEKIGENEYKIKRIRTIKSIETGESIEDVNFSPLKNTFKTTVHVFNDMIGAACAVLNKTKLDGDSTMFITTGGGFGVSHINKVKLNGENYLQITESRDGRRLIHGQALEEYGGSVPALIKNFLSKQNVSPQTIQELTNIGDARIVLNGNKELAQKYNLKNKPEATKFALDRYITALADGIRQKMPDGLDSVLMSGKLISGIDDFLIQNSQMYNKTFTNLSQEITEKLQPQIEKGKLPSIRIVNNIKDNSEGALYLENKKISTQMTQERDLPVMSLFVKI